MNFTVFRTKKSTNVTNRDIPARTKSLMYDSIDFNAACTRPYIFAASDERKNRFSKNKCFGCGQKGHIHKDYPIRLFKKIRRFSISSKSSPSSRSSSSHPSANHNSSSRASTRCGRSIRVFSRSIKSKKKSF